MKKRSSKHGASFAGKIKTEHAIVEGLYDLLKKIVAHDEIKSIIPGRIMKRGSTKKAVINLTIPTTTGWKAVGKSKGSTQDFFIVTDSPDQVEKIIKNIQN